MGNGRKEVSRTEADEYPPETAQEDPEIMHPVTKHVTGSNNKAVHPLNEALFIEDHLGI